MLLTACSSDEVLLAPQVEFSDVPVQFGVPDDFSYARASATRGEAYDHKWAEVQGNVMNVTAVHHQEGSNTPIAMMSERDVTHVTLDPTVLQWTYFPVVYWPTNGTMDFYGYAPSTDLVRNEFSSLTYSHDNYQAMLMKCHVPNSVVTTTDQFMAANNPETLAQLPHDAANQQDIMFAFQRNMKCTEQAVTSVVKMNFAHVMAGVKINFLTYGEINPSTYGDSHPDKDKIAFNIPRGTMKVLIGIGRIKTGGTLAICEPDYLGGAPNVEWTLDGLEGTFYESFNVDNSDPERPQLVIPLEDAEHPRQDIFFFPPQKLDRDLTVTAYFYNSENKRIGYRITTASGLGRFERGKIVTLKIR